MVNQPSKRLARHTANVGAHQYEVDDGDDGGGEAGLHREADELGDDVLGALGHDGVRCALEADNALPVCAAPEREGEGPGDGQVCQRRL